MLTRIQTFEIFTAVFLITTLSLTQTRPHARAESTKQERETAEAIRLDIIDSSRVTGDFDVEVDTGVAMLSGTTNSIQDKRLATKIAKRTKGIKAVVNEMIVRASDRTDEMIRDDVLKVLRINDSVGEPRIAVDVDRGEVALAGSVPSLAEKRIAEFAAAGVSGVREVDNQIAVELVVDRSDTEIRDEVSALIVQSVYLDNSLVSVDVENGVVQLSGEVPSAEAKDRLVQVSEIRGVIKVDASQVKIAPERQDASLRQKRYADATDTTIATAIARAIAADPLTFSVGPDIQIEVQDGIVTLEGAVSRLHTKQRLERLAVDTIGVLRVRNELQVQPEGESPSDQSIIDITQGALIRSAYLDKSDVRVHCQRAHVSLYGIVESKMAKQVAEWIASGVEGVVHVNNYLTVSPTETEKTDQQIADALHRKLQFAFYDKANDIDFKIADGVVILSGQVDTWRQWQLAMDLAIEAGGHTPHNLIDVRYHPPHGASDVFVP